MKDSSPSSTSTLAASSRGPSSTASRRCGLLTIRRAEEIAHADPRWVAAMQARHIDTSRVSVLVGLPERAQAPAPRHRPRRERVRLAARRLPPTRSSSTGFRLSVNLTREVSTRSPRRRARRVAPTLRRRRRARLAARTARSAAHSTSRRAPRYASPATRSRGTAGAFASASILGADSRFTTSRSPTAAACARCSTADPSARSSRRTAIPSFSTWYPRDEGDYGMGIYSQSSAVALNDVPPNADVPHRDDARPSRPTRSPCRAPSPSTSATAEFSGVTRTCRDARVSSSSAATRRSTTTTTSSTGSSVRTARSRAKSCSPAS